ncbi:MAG: hypothetical protein ABIQ04_03890 [Candidatus Saccharimonadales bacterium]
MKKINIRKTYYHISHRYFTINNVVITIALLIGASWAWGSIGVMQRNYDLQKEVDGKSRQQKLADLEVQSLAFEKKYYQSNEYQELAVRDRLGLVTPGESVLILPQNSEAAKNADIQSIATITAKPVAQQSKFQQWMNFIFGGNKQQ